MSSPPFWRWDVWVGNNPPFIFRLKDSLGVARDLTGVSLRLRAAWSGGGALAMNSGDSGFQILTQSGATLGQFQITFTTAQTRLFPADATVTYEIEQLLSGEEITVLRGEIAVAGGVNTDG
jgi:hypothetical protein